MTTPMAYQLWMGNLGSNMTENSIIAAFKKMGEGPTGVRLMHNKFTGGPAGYCFVNFVSETIAMEAMRKLNGKPIPDTNPTVLFRLSSAINSHMLPRKKRDFSIWVGNLSPDVDDYQLYKVFSTKYNSIKNAKVILDGSGFSKGYAFLRFGIEGEQQSALRAMNGYIGLGTKPIKIWYALPKSKPETGFFCGNTNYGHRGPYRQRYNSWRYYSHGPLPYPDNGYVQRFHSRPRTWSEQNSAQFYYEQSAATQTAGNGPVSKDAELVEYNINLDVHKMNRETIDADRHLYDALESAKWMSFQQFDTI